MIVQTKKHKHACESLERGDENISIPDCDVNINLTHLFKLVEGISLEVRSLNDRVFTRIEKLETNFTRNIAENMTKMMDIKIQKEVSKVKSEITKEIVSVKNKVIEVENACAPLHAAIAEVKSDVSSIKSNMSKMHKSQNPEKTGDISLNIVIRNLPQTHGENVLNKVNGLVKDGLKIKDVSVMTAERKANRSDYEHGIVIAKCASANDKRKIMSNKRNLKSDRKYSRVYIDHDMSREDRIMASNLKSIVKAVGNNKLYVRGNRICSSTPREHSDRGDQQQRSNVVRDRRGAQ